MVVADKLILNGAPLKLFPSKTPPVGALNQLILLLVDIAVKSTLPPGSHNETGLDVKPAGADGKGFEVTLIVDVLVQPLPSVPVTVYVAVPKAGTKATLFETPPVQEYELAPLPLKVT